MVEKHHGDDDRITLDGNELYQQAEEFDALAAAIEGEAALRIFWRNTLVMSSRYTGRWRLIHRMSGR